MKYWLEALLATIAIVVLGIWLWMWSSSAKSTANDPLPGQAQGNGSQKVKSKSAPVVRNNLKNEPLSARELRDIMSAFEVDEDKAIPDFEVVVANGETVLTAGQELPGGVFLFSSITPTATRLADGTKAITLDTKRFKMTVSGDYQDLYSTSATIPMDTVAVFSHSANDKLLHLTIKASQDDASGGIRIRSNEKAKQNPNMAPRESTK